MATLMHAGLDHSVDFVLALILTVGGVIGAQTGANIGSRLKAEQLRAALALLILAIAFRLVFELAVTPDDLYSLTVSV
jgi:uncharacterized membrane protein YfcA